jgi:hypothetical protein
MSMLGVCELVAVGILLLCNCLNLMNVFGLFDGHQVRPIASLTNFIELFAPSAETAFSEQRHNSVDEVAVKHKSAAAPGTEYAAELLLTGLIKDEQWEGE